MTKSNVLNPNYESEGRCKHVLKPKNLIIVEGYLALQNNEINKLFDYKIYLDIPIEQSMKRRNKVTYNDESEYNKRILIPMYNKYVEPTKDHADIVINVLEDDKDTVCSIVKDELRELDFLPS